MPHNGLLFVADYDLQPNSNYMGVGRIFPKEGTKRFSKIFLVEAKTGEICFFPLETKKTTLFAEIFKI